MDILAKLAPLYISLFILVALQTTKAFVLQNQPPSSLNTSQVIPRTDQPITLDPYSGNGAPPAQPLWFLLKSGPLQYTPTASNITLEIHIKNNKAGILSNPDINSLTVLSLAEIAISAAETNGNQYIRSAGQKNSTFATSYQPTNMQFMMTASNDLPIYAVSDVLRAMQELTHYLFFLELTFDVFSGIANPPIASGCLAYNCGSQMEMLQSRDLEYANFSTTNFSTTPSRRLQSSIAPIQLTRVNELESVAVTYDELQHPLPIHGQSFADVADRILANITDLIIANQGDGLLPFTGTGHRRLFHYIDTWGSTLGISLLPYNLLGINFTLGQAAVALKATQNHLNDGPLVESLLKITVDGAMVGWGCLRYTNTSAWRCLMPAPGSFSSSGSQSSSGQANVITDPNTTA